MKPQAALINPITLPPLDDLTDAEKAFVKKMARGEAHIINEFLPKEEILRGDKANIIRADVICFFAWGGDETHPMRGDVIHLQGAVVPHTMDLSHARFPRTLRLLNCFFGNRLHMQFLACRLLDMSGSYLAKGLSGEGMEIKSDVYMQNGFCSHGSVRLLNTSIRGVLDCSAGRFMSPEGVSSFHADSIKVGGNIFMTGGFSAEGEVRLLSARVGGDLYCCGNIINKGGDALVVDRIKVEGNVFLNKGFSAEGGVSFPNAYIGGDFYCNGKFANQNGIAFAARGTKIGRSLFLSEEFSAKGTVELTNARIDGGLFCHGGKFKNKKGDALIADTVTVGGSVFFNNGFAAEGQVRLLNANINGSMHSDACRFKNTEGDAFCADGITVGGDFLMRDKFSATGKVRLCDARIGRDLYCSTCAFNNGLIARSAEVKGSLVWRNANGGGTVDLSFASVNIVDDDESREKFQFLLPGFSCTRFANPTDVESRIGWLNNRPKGEILQLQPYEQVARVLFSAGRGTDARRVLFEMEKRHTEEVRKAAIEIENIIPKMNLPRRVFLQQRFWARTWLAWRWFFEKATGYNYYLWRMFVTSLFIIALGAPVFGAANHFGYIVPHQPVVLANSDYKDIVRGAKAHVGNCSAAKRPRPTPAEAAECLFPGYPRFNALWFSMDVFLPTAPLHQEAYWYPHPQPEDYTVARFFLLAWYWFQILAGWVLTSVFVLTVTGILQQRQATGK